MNNNSNKPKEILELEKEYSVTIQLNTKKTPYGLVYKLNSKGEIIELSLNSCQIHDSSLIERLTSLKSLHLSNNRISSMSFVNLHCLERLYLGGNKISDFDSLIHLTNLRELAIWENPIKNVSILGKLTKLEKLYIQRCGIDTANFLATLKNLKDFSCETNLISEVTIPKDSQARYLNFSSNFIKQIPHNIAKQYNYLTKTKSEDLPRSMRTGMVLNDNPLKYPPTSVIELGSENVKNYYEASENFGSEPISEGRVIVVGDGSAGKSSLIERILYDTFESGKLQTNGVLIDRYLIQHNNRNLLFHIWDFGGQEIQHAVHKFFFNEGCLYILVLDNRKEEDPEYWLRQIESLGSSAPVLLVFNKTDENTMEITDRKFLKQKYSNIVGFYNISCKSGEGIKKFKKDFEQQAINLATVDEKFPNNWLNIKNAIEKSTAGQHYLTYDLYRKICNENNVGDSKVQNLLLKYFTTIGAVTWFGDTYLNFLHVLSPSWITQGVYKIITSQKTARLSGKININDFKELLEPISSEDYTYNEEHYGYILSMMKKFDLCYSPDNETLLLPSAFGKTPNIEYDEFLDPNVRSYILQFKDYMPPMVLHKFMAKKLQDAYDDNFWFSGIVISDKMTSSLAMVHSDRELKRIYIRIKGENKLGVWEHIRREFESVTRNTFVIYSELVVIDPYDYDGVNYLDNLTDDEYTVEYEDLISHLKANKSVYFHAKLRKDYNVGYLIGMFEDKNTTIEKLKQNLTSELDDENQKVQPIIVNILNQNTPQITSNVSNTVDINIDLTMVNNLNSELQGDLNYLIDTLNENDKELIKTLKKLINFTDDIKKSKEVAEIKERGWARKLKGLLNSISASAEKIKNIDDGTEVLLSVYKKIKVLADSYSLNDVTSLIEILLSKFNGK